MTAETTEADVVVVGAGPGGAATAAHLAMAGRHVVVLDKAVFPRDKACGDGLTPRAVRELLRLGFAPAELARWQRQVGLRIWAGRPAPYLLPWPRLRDFPNYSLVRRRTEFDAALVAKARAAGAVVEEGVHVDQPLLDAQGRVSGVAARDGRRYRAPVTVAADGNSARLAVALGWQRRPDRPMGVAVRAYFASPRSDEVWLESWLELWDGVPGASNLLPGYGWVFPMGDGTCNVGLGMLSTAAGFGRTDYRDLLRRWLANTPAAWGFREAAQASPIRGAALPMGFDRGPAYGRGLVLVGDAAGLVSPFNGEGISYALESGRYAAAAIDEALGCPRGGPAAEAALRRYPRLLSQAWGSHFRIGNLFTRFVGHAGFMRFASRYALAVPGVPELVHRLMANLADERPADGYDVVVHALRGLAPPL
ncbi:MAG: geranylgeranyl reductase family protein [Propionibacteriaceae bacterium]|jgi:geranylgeranyl reductase family protein|nr:geranylgeranyl reductase family protein [Propionibacteriaceae bacterium]